jgi:hypothetical protein
MHDGKKNGHRDPNEPSEVPHIPLLIIDHPNINKERDLLCEQALLSPCHA